MSGWEMLQQTMIEQVNVEGTRNIVNACLIHNEQLVYTSTYNVIFGGQEIVNGNEDLPYFPLQLHTDTYSRTKAIAEHLVLTSSVPACAIRACAIYGSGETRHYPRMIYLIRAGLVSIAAFGKRDSLQDWIHVHDLVEAHILAAIGLIERPAVVSGSAFL